MTNAMVKCVVCYMYRIGSSPTDVKVYVFNCRSRIFFAKACTITDKYIPSNKKISFRAQFFFHSKINVRIHFISFDLHRSTVHRVMHMLWFSKCYTRQMHIAHHLNYYLKWDLYANATNIEGATRRERDRQNVGKKRKINFAVAWASANDVQH